MRSTRQDGWIDVDWGPHSTPFNGDLDPTRLDVYIGETNPATGEVLIVVTASDLDAGDITFSSTSPKHGTLQMVRARQGTVAGRPLGPANAEGVGYLYTPREQYRADADTYLDDFSFTVASGRAGCVTHTVPLIIGKKATLTPVGALPYNGDGPFCGQIVAPFGDVAGYIVDRNFKTSQMSVQDLLDAPSFFNQPSYGAVTVDAHGHFTYARDSTWDFFDYSEVDDGFYVVAYTAKNKWAAAYVPVGGAATLVPPTMASTITELSAV